MWFLLAGPDIASEEEVGNEVDDGDKNRDAPSSEPANGNGENGSGGGEGVAQFGVNSSLAGKFPFPFNMI